MPQDLRVFLKQLINRPHEVVALAPSSSKLAQAMAQEVPGGDGPVVELGAGTGKITQALLDAGIGPNGLHAFEVSPEFVSHLKAHFTEITVHHAPAQSMGALGLANVRAVVSGLPLLSMPNRIQDEILEATRMCLAPGGVFIQFTYGPTPPIAESLRAKFGLTWAKSNRIWGNLPPARVYTFRFAGH